MPKKTGTELIAEERQRQISQEGWTPEHDDTHKRGELSAAAAAYSIASQNLVLGVAPSAVRKATGYMYWPADWGPFKMTDAVIPNLVKAGALIAAEIDRLQRLEGK